MPHLILEYSSNLADADSIGLLCQQLARCLDAQREADQRVYPLGGIRVRAYRCEVYCVADGTDADAAFLHGVLKIGAGRSESTKKATGDAVFEIIKQHFAERFRSHGLALSLEINEFSDAGSWKHNNLHARLQR
jgi:5-carboxymethyl-2-hydroxymuconate isomerase